MTHAPSTPGIFDVFRSKRMAVLFLLGFSGGLPLMLTSQTLQAWMTDAKVNLGTIADLSAVGLAYTLKVLWAPLLDRYQLPFLGRRRGWCLAFQLSLIGAIAVMGAVDPITEPLLLAGIAVTVAFLSASQDIIIDAYKADILAPHERAAGSAMYVLGYRVALLVTTTLALVMADHMSWGSVYAVMAAFMAIGLVGTLLADEPDRVAGTPRTLAGAVVDPFIEFFKRLGVWGMLLVFLFAALYRFGDYFAQTLIIVFLKQGVGFSNTDVALVNKMLGFAGTLVGGLAAGSLVARFGLRRMLVAFGVLAAVTNLLYAWLAVVGPDYILYGCATALDHTTIALSTAVFLSILMAVCSPAVSATQFAFLTSLSSIGQRLFGPFADDVVVAVGWHGFFISTALMAIPGLFLAWRVARDVKGDV